MKISAVALLLWLCTACGGPEPRKPVEDKAKSSFKASVERNKKHLALEEQAFRRIMAQDTLHEYLASPNGFWYYFELKNDTATYTPQPGDQLLFSHTLMSLNNDTIYSAEAIGPVSYVVDKQPLFPGLQQALKLLKVKEKATFLFPSSQAYGYRGDGDAIGPQTPIKSSVTLHSLRKHQKSFNP